MVFRQIILLSTLIFCVLTFQNCGNGFQGNGDPYEIFPPAPSNPIDPPPGGGNSAPPPGEGNDSFVRDVVCTPISSHGAFGQLLFGWNNQQYSVRISSRDYGTREILFPKSPLNTHLRFSEKLVLTLVSQSGSQAHIDYVLNGSPQTEIFNCSAVR